MLDITSTTNDGVQGVPQKEIAAMGYIRDADGHEAASVILTAIYDMPEDSQLQLALARYGRGGGANATGITLENDGSSIQMVKIAPSLSFP